MYTTVQYAVVTANAIVVYYTGYYSVSIHFPVCWKIGNENRWAAAASGVLYFRPETAFLQTGAIKFSSRRVRGRNVQNIPPTHNKKYTKKKIVYGRISYYRINVSQIDGGGAAVFLNQFTFNRNEVATTWDYQNKKFNKLILNYISYNIFIFYYT